MTKRNCEYGVAITSRLHHRDMIVGLTISDMKGNLCGGLKVRERVQLSNKMLSYLVTQLEEYYSKRTYWRQRYDMARDHQRAGRR